MRSQLMRMIILLPTITLGAAGCGGGSSSGASSGAGGGSSGGDSASTPPAPTVPVPGDVSTQSSPPTTAPALPPPPATSGGGANLPALGTHFPDAQLCALRVGVSTVDDIVAKLGAPAARASPSVQRTTLFYSEGDPTLGHSIWFHVDSGVLHHVGRSGSVVPVCLGG